MAKRDESQETQDLNRRIDAMLTRANTAQTEWEPIYADGVNYVFNNQLGDRKTPEGWPRVQVNKLFPAVMQELAVMAQRNVQIATLPFEDSDGPGAEFWAKLHQYHYDRTLKMSDFLERSRLDSRLYGQAVAKVYWEPKAQWDEEAKRWRGEPRLTLIRPERFGIDPDAETNDPSDAEFCYTRRRVTVAYAKNRWPQYADQIETAADDGEDALIGIGSGTPWPGSNADGDKDAGTEGELDGRLASALTPPEDDDSDVNVKDGEAKAAYVFLLEVFFRDDSERMDSEETEIPFYELVQTGAVRLNPSTNEYVLSETGESVRSDNRPRLSRAYSRPRFPNGRHVLRIGKTILNPLEKDQVWPYKRWPFVIGMNYILPHTWHGLNDVEIAKPMQDWVNETAADLGAYVQLHAMPVAKVEEGALHNDPEMRKTNGELKAGPGTIIKLAAGRSSGVSREPPPPMSQTVFAIYDKMSAELRDQTGVQEIGMGRQAEGGITATEAIRLETNTRLRSGLQAAHEDTFILEIMWRVHDVCKANMEVGEMVRIVGEGSSAKMMAVGPEAFDSQFDMTLKTTTGLPFDEERKKQEAMTLFQTLAPIGGPVYLDRLLKAFKIDNPEEILSRVQAWGMMQQAMQAQASQPQSVQEPSAGQAGA